MYVPIYFYSFLNQSIFSFGCDGSLLLCGLFSSCGRQASHCGGFLLLILSSRAQAQQLW